MSSEIERFRELGRLIRAAQSELATLQLHLIEAHERRLDPVRLGVEIADLGRQVSQWKREQEGLFRQIVGEEETASMSSIQCCRILDRRNLDRRHESRMRPVSA